MSILEKILIEKEKEVKALINQTFVPVEAKKITTFKERVRVANTMAVISEIKRSSPSKGEIKMTVDPVTQAKQYEAYGAAAISVLTDKPFFNGTMDDLRAVREAVDLPILCKDFIIHRIQIDQAKAAGASIILLIVAALSTTDLENLYYYARSLDLEVLVEVHNEEEMKTTLQLNPEIIGINNRNLKTFEVNLETTEKLAAMLTNPNTILISESGMKTAADVVRARDAGAKAILVGETLMRADNLEQTFQKLKVALPAGGAK
ncbi:indole-3-glycerol phosphate synthase TrpC [Oceanobacillus chungangensis]|uniref:Indole-3-glycerol phosphate synthase n=1 Tax=Oceanobacillus chungangensis TaxID=1229152 RepID=A0A3D8Q2E8_9BACI|nr:indole-3-glycerol phosphate synthase TrpC [Oceanobacillus chungangensis]RDW21205.1 indole-3-glycerol phosphate synthase TrpC [Oceanobacillus chungangensis]